MDQQFVVPIDFMFLHNIFLGIAMQIDIEFVILLDSHGNIFDRRFPVYYIK